MGLLLLRFLSKTDKEEVQKRGYMCEHLLCWYSMSSDQIALFNDDFPVYLNGYREADIIFFGLSNKGLDQVSCVRELLKLPVHELNVISPEALNIPSSKTIYEDWDYHINLKKFDLNLNGSKYKGIRYSVKRANKMDYSFKLSRKFTRDHVYVMSRHITRHSLDLWDLE